METKITGKRLQAKDLISVGIFTAIYFAVIFVVAMTGYVPVFIPLLSVLVPLIGGIPFMLFLTRVKKFGMVLIMSVLIGLLYLVMGMGLYTLPLGVVTGLIAEFILKSGNYESAKKAVLTYGVFAIMIFGNFLPIFIAREAYYDSLTSGSYGVEYAEALMAFMPYWIAPLLVIACFVFGVLGGLLGRVVLKKHFERAGIA